MKTKAAVALMGTLAREDSKQSDACLIAQSLRNHPSQVEFLFINVKHKGERFSKSLRGIDTLVSVSKGKATESIFMSSAWTAKGLPQFPKATILATQRYLSKP